MRKKKYYRLVKVENTYITRNKEPELYTETTYEIERKIGLFGKWEVVSAYEKNLKKTAEIYLALLKSKPKKIVIK
jgi:hypothetical protein